MSFKLRVLTAALVSCICLSAWEVCGHRTTGTDSCLSKEEIMDWMSQVESKTKQLQKTLDTVLHQLHKQKAINEKFAAENRSIRKDGESMKQQIELLMTDGVRHDEESAKVAFGVVSHLPFGPLENRTNIPYEVILTNVGGGWSPVMNAFVAPVTGVYKFTASLVSGYVVSTQNILCHITHFKESGQITVATLLGSPSYYDGDSNSAIVEMQLGDIVSVQLRSGDAVITSSSETVYSSFSGFLLFTLD